MVGFSGSVGSMRAMRSGARPSAIWSDAWAGVGVSVVVAVGPSIAAGGADPSTPARRAVVGQPQSVPAGEISVSRGRERGTDGAVRCSTFADGGETWIGPVSGGFSGLGHQRSPLSLIEDILTCLI